MITLLPDKAMNGDCRRFRPARSSSLRTACHYSALPSSDACGSGRRGRSLLARYQPSTEPRLPPGRDKVTPMLGNAGQAGHTGRGPEIQARSVAW
jgi:hypothetical protein